MKSIDPKDTEKLKQLISDCNDKELLQQMVKERWELKRKLQDDDYD